MSEMTTSQHGSATPCGSSDAGRRTSDADSLSSSELLACELLSQTASTQTWNSWNPDESPAPSGCFSMTSLADDLVDAGQLLDADRQRFVSTIDQAARDGRFAMTLTMFGCRGPQTTAAHRSPTVTLFGSVCRLPSGAASTERRIRRAGAVVARELKHFSRPEREISRSRPAVATPNELVCVGAPWTGGPAVRGAWLSPPAAPAHCLCALAAPAGSRLRYRRRRR